MKRLAIKRTITALYGLLARLHAEKHPFKKRNVKVTEVLIEYWEEELLKS